MAMKQEQLIDHLDNIQQGLRSRQMDQQIGADAEAAQDWKDLLVAVEGLQDAGLHEQVQTVRAEWQAQQAAAPQSGRASIRSISRIAIRAAACVLILAGGAAVYKYSITNATHIYSSYCTPYELNTDRGTAAQDEMDAAYQNHDWAAVTGLFKNRKEKTNKSWFLAGMAALESKHYDDAIGLFQQVIAANTQSGSDYFEDEAEFYLAMSWLARNDVRNAMPLLDKMRTDSNHKYHDIVVKMSSLDLRIAEYKELK